MQKKSELKEAREYDHTKYEKPSVTTDLVIFSLRDEKLNILLVKRKEWPFEGKYALPGGFVKMDETLDEAAKRELEEETGVKNIYLEQLYTFGDVKRDPRLRVITVSYLALIHSDNVKLQAGSDAAAVKWHPVSDLPELAFDHDSIIKYALERLRGKLSYSNIAFGLLPELFTLTQVQKAYEEILGHPIDKRNFRKKLDSLNLVEKTMHMSRGGAYRPAALYKKKNEKFELRTFD